MKTEIKNRQGEVLFEMETDSVRAALEAAVMAQADLGGADLGGARLRGVDLEGAMLFGANLSVADLRGANLCGANLGVAALGWADLREADLCGADLGGANLRLADLRGADMYGAAMFGADLGLARVDGEFIMPDGLSFQEYLAEVVPVLLTAGGKSLAEVLATDCWGCHAWDNCPMRVAFGITRPQDAPAPLRARVAEFVQFFDAGLIPEPH